MHTPSPGTEASERLHPHRQLGSAGLTPPHGSSAGTKCFLQVAQRGLGMAQICALPAQCAGSLLSWPGLSISRPSPCPCFLPPGHSQGTAVWKEHRVLLAAGTCSVWVTANSRLQGRELHNQVCVPACYSSSPYSPAF